MTEAVESIEVKEIRSLADVEAADTEARAFVRERIVRIMSDSNDISTVGSENG